MRNLQKHLQAQQATLGPSAMTPFVLTDPEKIKDLEAKIKSLEFKVKTLENDLDNAQRGLSDAWDDGWQKRAWWTASEDEADEPTNPYRQENK